MKVRPISTGTFVWILFASVAARAEGPPDTLELLKKVDSATRAVNAVAYEGEFYGIGDEAFVKKTGHVRGQVKAMRGRQGLLTSLFGGPAEMLYFKGEVQLPNTTEWISFEIASDGREVFRLEPATRTWIHGELPEAKRLLNRGRALFMREFLHDRPFSDEIEGRRATYEGEREIDGVPCYVVYVVYQNTSESRWFFGKDDYLPRRVERIVSETDPVNAVVQEVHQLDANPDLSRDLFRLEAPTGYVRREYEAEPGEPQSAGLLPVGATAPGWELKTPEGRTVRLSDLRGKVVVLDFWASWCAPCKLAMPGVQDLHESFKNDPVEVIGINCWERGDGAAGYMREKGYTYELLVDGDAVANAYKLDGLPTFYVVDPDGKIAYSSSGFRFDREKEIAAVISKSIKQENR